MSLWSRGVCLSRRKKAFCNAVIDGAESPLRVIFDRGSELCRPPTSASPRKLTSGPNEKLVAMGQSRHFAPQKNSEAFSQSDGLTVAAKTIANFNEKASRLYEQECCAALAAAALEMYVRRWVRWTRGSTLERTPYIKRIELATTSKSGCSASSTATVSTPPSTIPRPQDGGLTPLATDINDAGRTV